LNYKLKQTIYKVTTKYSIAMVVVDIGVNLGNKAFRNNWREVVQRALDAGVNPLILTGTSIAGSEKCKTLAQTWLDETGQKNMYFTVGIHPHEAKTFNAESLRTMKKLLQHPLAVAVGECGLDFNRDFSPRPLQLQAFREQIKLACELQLPMFVHERNAHRSLIDVLDQICNDPMVSQPLPPIVVRCFTGNECEALEYIRRGYYIGFTGTICKKERGAPLRHILPKLPLEQLMIETDAPFMGFKNDRRGSEPADTVGVARQLASVMNVDIETVCDITTTTTLKFFRIEGAATNGAIDVKGKVVVGMAPTKNGKTKSALRREKEKKKKQEAAKVVPVEETAVNTAPPMDPEKRARKLRKMLKQIDTLKKKDTSSLNEDQKKKLKMEKELQDEIARMGL
jgi:TatD DNase family protein